MYPLCGSLYEKTFEVVGSLQWWLTALAFHNQSLSCSCDYLPEKGEARHFAAQSHNPQLNNVESVIQWSHVCSIESNLPRGYSCPTSLFHPSALSGHYSSVHSGHWRLAL